MTEHACLEVDSSTWHAASGQRNHALFAGGTLVADGIGFGLRLTAQRRRRSDGSPHALDESDGLLRLHEAPTGDTQMPEDRMPQQPSRDPGQTQRKMEDARRDRRVGQDRRADGILHLTPREREVLALVLQGEQNKEIAARLGLAEQSAKQHVSDLLRKFGVPNRAALAEAGARLDLVGESIERSWFPQLFRGASLQIAVTAGPEHRYVVANEAFARAAGRDVVGKTMREAFPELADSPNHEMADRVYRTGESVIGHEVAGVLERGAGLEVTYTDGVIQALRGDDGTIEGLVYFLMDVTEQVRPIDGPGT